MISVHFHSTEWFEGKPFNFTVIQAYTITSNAEEVAVGWFYKDLQDLLELTHTHTHTHTKLSFSLKGTGMQK